jgi:hypothetical protein
VQRAASRRAFTRRPAGHRRARASLVAPFAARRSGVDVGDTAVPIIATIRFRSARALRRVRRCARIGRRTGAGAKRSPRPVRTVGLRPLPIESAHYVRVFDRPKRTCQSVRRPANKECLRRCQRACHPASMSLSTSVRVPGSVVRSGRSRAGASSHRCHRHLPLPLLPRAAESSPMSGVSWRATRADGCGGEMLVQSPRAVWLRQPPERISNG